MKKFTVLYKKVNRYSFKHMGRDQDMSVYTFTCEAVSTASAVRKLKDSLTYTTRDAKGKTHKHVTPFDVVRVTSDKPFEVTKVATHFSPMMLHNWYKGK